MLVQAATLGQTFGLLSGIPDDLMLAETFHGTIMSWTRSKAFESLNSLENISVEHISNVQGAWISWIVVEESIRVKTALHIVDAGLSALFHREPLFRHDPERFPRCTPEDMFSAPTSEVWFAMLRNSQTPSVGGQDVLPSVMSAYASLASLHAILSELNYSVAGRSSDPLRDALKQWRESRASHDHDHDPFSLIVLWHGIFMSLYASFDLLERVSGKDGPDFTTKDLEQVTQWADGEESRSSMAHALLILRHVQAMSIGDRLPVHVPPAVFSAGLVIYCHLKFSLSTTPASVNFDLEELQPTPWPSGRVTDTVVPTMSTFNDVVGLLRRHGQLGISQRFASILELLLEDLIDSGKGNISCNNSGTPLQDFGT